MSDQSAVVRPTYDDPVARAASEVVGGPAGAHSRPHSWWTPVRVVLAICAVTLALGVVQKAPCVQSKWLSETTRYGFGCYSDIPYLYPLRGMAERQWPYADTHGRYEALEYPVGISYFAWFTALLTEPIASGPPESVRARTDPASYWGMPGFTTEVNQYFVVNVVLLAAAGLLAAYFLSGSRRRRPWDAMAYAASPVLLLAAYTNWDLLAVVCVAGALWAWARGRPLLTGVFIGLGTATKLYPVFLLGALLVLCVRRREARPLLVATAAAVASWVIVDLPAWLTGFAQWNVFWSFNASRGPDLGSLWLLASLHGHGASVHTVNTVSWVVFALVCAAVAALGLLAPRPASLSQLGFLLVAGFLLVNKVYSPQYVLWLLPLAVLARPRWRDLLIWQACEIAYFFGVWWYLGSFTASSATDAPDPAYSVAIVVRVLGELYLVGLVIADVWRGSGLEEAEPQLITTRSKSVVV